MTPLKIWDAVVVGAGAAGIFAALRAKECSPDLEILVLERSAKPLRKVAISGGGRCNVTHECHSLDWLLSCYPRGGPRLEAILGRFMPEDTVRWFSEQGVDLKTEADGRMFPVSNTSSTIIDCLLDCARRRGIPLKTDHRIDNIVQADDDCFELQSRSEMHLTRKVLLATGGGSAGTKWLRAFGHTVVPDIPSLFTFCSQHPVIDGLPGVSVPDVKLRLLLSEHDEPSATYEVEGPFLITHWGVSGPAVLKLSAFAARGLASTGYQAELLCDLLPQETSQSLRELFARQRSDQQIAKRSPVEALPKRLWTRLVQHAGLSETTRWNGLSNAKTESIVQAIKALKLPVKGKGVFKEEFVTAGGLPLPEIDPYTMESRRVSNLFVAGELLDVDGITGGFNFQNAWATGYIAGEGLSG